MKTTDVLFIALFNFSRPSDIKKATYVKKLIKKVINHTEFHDAVKNADFKDRRFVETDGTVKTIENNEEILDLLLKGNEQYGTNSENYVWDFKITLYRSWTGEIGHRKGDNIFTKKRKFRKMTAINVASHWIHEYCHTIGFTHDFKNTDRRKHSVPYEIGSISYKILKNL